MSGNSKQDVTKKVKRSVKMSPTEAELAAADAWARPPSHECEEQNYRTPLPGADENKVALNIRLVYHLPSYALVLFSLALLVRQRGAWVQVAEVDTCHDVDAHLHQYGRSTGKRISTPGVLLSIAEQADVQAAYDTCLSMLEEEWSTYKERWHYG